MKKIIIISIMCLMLITSVLIIKNSQYGKTELIQENLTEAQVTKPKFTVKYYSEKQTAPSRKIYGIVVYKDDKEVQRFALAEEGFVYMNPRIIFTDDKTLYFSVDHAYFECHNIEGTEEKTKECRDLLDFVQKGYRVAGGIWEYNIDANQIVRIVSPVDLLQDPQASFISMLSEQFDPETGIFTISVWEYPPHGQPFKKIHNKFTYVKGSIPLLIKSEILEQ